MKNKFSLLIFSLVLMFLLGSFERVSACSCIAESPVCQAFGKADAVFVGKVIGAKSQQKVKNENGKENTFANQETFFQVSEAFFGAENNTQITLFDGYTTCDYSFQIGETYLVYAYADEKKLITDICSRTRPISKAGEDLIALRNLANEKDGTTINGLVTELGQLSLLPLNKHKVQLQAIEGKFETSETFTDRQGKFLFPNIPAGKYKILPALPNLMRFSLDEEYWFEVEVTGKGCENKSFTIVNDSSFRGKLVNAQGQPVSSATVEFIPTTNNFDTENYQTLSIWTDTTNDDGSFSFKNVASGNYFLAVNVKNPPYEDAHFPTMFYPNVSELSQAEIFTVKLGQKTSGIVFTAPSPLKEIEIGGVITREDGKSPVDIQVRLKDVGKNQSTIIDSEMIDEDGSFSFKGYEGRTYIIEAFEFMSEESETLQIVSSEFVLKKDISNLKLVFKKIVKQK